MKTKRNLVAVLGIAMLVGFGVTAGATEWQTNFAEASTNAAKTGMYMLVDFSGSDWCGWCMKLDEEVFGKAEFAAFAKKNLICVSIDFPRKTEQSKALKEQNNALAQKYAVQGFPTVLILSPKGELVTTTGYEAGGAKKYVESLQQVIADHKQKLKANVRDAKQ